MINKTDIVIAGNGMVGLMCAAALADSHFNVTVVAPSLPQAPDLSNYSLRVSAINQGVINALARLSIWPDIIGMRAAPYKAMDVWDKDNIGRVQFSTDDIEHLNSDSENLGYIIENDVTRYALWKRVAQASNIQSIEGEISQLNADNDVSLVMLAQGQVIQTKLVIAADGANSQVRRLMNMPLSHSDYDQQAIVATIQTEQPHGGVARQVFTQFGPLALLPLADSNRCSIVFSQQTEQAKLLNALDDESFNKRLTATSDSVLGRLTLHSERASFPLKMRYARDFIKHNVVLIGDAAHTIHPLAGQGANLGFMDALAVAECLVEAGKVDITRLQQLMRWRKSDAFDRIAAMESFHRGFTSELAPIKVLRGLALQVADVVSPIKQRLIAEAMGTTGHLPKLAQPIV